MYDPRNFKKLKIIHGEFMENPMNEDPCMIHSQYSRQIGEFMENSWKY